MGLPAIAFAVSPPTMMPVDSDAVHLEMAYRSARPLILADTANSPHAQAIRSQLRITRLTPRVQEELTGHWNRLAYAGHPHVNPQEVASLANNCFSRDEETGLIKRPDYFEQGRFEAAFWLGQHLCAVTKGDAVVHGSVLPVDIITAAPEPHALKGHVFRAVHHVATAFARLKGADTIRYQGPLSTGSILQVERGAIAIDRAQHARMWLAQSVHTPVDPATIPVAERYVHGQSPLPADVRHDNRRAYQRVFNKIYRPPEWD